jgi:hypothetical protein
MLAMAKSRLALPEAQLIRFQAASQRFTRERRAALSTG